MFHCEHNAYMTVNTKCFAVNTMLYDCKHKVFHCEHNAYMTVNIMLYDCEHKVFHCEHNAYMTVNTMCVTANTIHVTVNS